MCAFEWGTGAPFPAAHAAIGLAIVLQRSGHPFFGANRLDGQILGSCGRGEDSDRGAPPISLFSKQTSARYSANSTARVES
jgi:hypothetical protein